MTSGGISYEASQEMCMDEFKWFVHKCADDARKEQEQLSERTPGNRIGLEHYGT